MKRVQFGRRMLRSFKIGTRCTRKLMDLWGRQDVGNEHDGGVQRHMGDWQHARRLRGNHRLTAIMGRRASSHSSAYSPGPGSSRTCNPQIASPKGRPRPKPRIVSCPSYSFDSRRIRRFSQRKDTNLAVRRLRQSRLASHILTSRVYTEQVSERRIKFAWVLLC